MCMHLKSSAVGGTTNCSIWIVSFRSTEWSVCCWSCIGGRAVVVHLNFWQAPCSLTQILMNRTGVTAALRVIAVICMFLFIYAIVLLLTFLYPGEHCLLVIQRDQVSHIMRNALIVCPISHILRQFPKFWLVLLQTDNCRQTPFSNLTFRNDCEECKNCYTQQDALPTKHEIAQVDQRLLLLTAY